MGGVGTRGFRVCQLKDTVVVYVATEKERGGERERERGGGGGGEERERQLNKSTITCWNATLYKTECTRLNVHACHKYKILTSFV